MTTWADIKKDHVRSIKFVCKEISKSKKWKIKLPDSGLSYTINQVLDGSKTPITDYKKSITGNMLTMTHSSKQYGSAKITINR